MEIVVRKLSELKQNEENIRMHPDTQIREYVRSLEKNGQLKLIVIDEDNVIWIGNGLYQAMMKAGWDEAKCLVKRGMTRQQKIKMMMADNRIFDLGVDDMSVFDRMINELAGDFDIPGYDDELLNSLIASSDEVSDSLFFDILNSFDGYLAQAKLAEAEQKTIPDLQQQVATLAQEKAELNGKVESLELQLTDTQMALCDVYELALGG